MKEFKEVETTSMMPLSQVASQHNDYLRFRIDPSPILKRLQRIIGAKEWDREKGWVRDFSREPIAKDCFINDLMFIFEGYMHHNNLMGNIDRVEAHKITYELVKAAIIMIAMRREYYGIDASKRSIIVRLIDDNIYMTLTHAVGDGQRFHDDMSFRPSQVSRGIAQQYEDLRNPK